MCNVEAWLTQRMAKSEGEGVFHMIRNQFNQWAVRQTERLQSLAISTEQAKQGDVDEQLIPDPSTGFIHESEYAIGQVTVWFTSCLLFITLGL